VRGAENSEVLPAWVAVAVTLSPTATAWAGLKENVPVLPLALVVTLFWPMNFLPSFVPGGLEKYLMVKVFCGVLLRRPTMLVELPEVWVAATSVHHQQCFWSNGLPRRLYDRFVERVVVASEESPTDLERLETPVFQFILPTHST
jgi:hypothetical protein